jgi:hypothetical protein
VSEQTASEDSEKDQYPPDSQFGRAAAADAELVDEIEKSGASAGDLPEGSSRREDVRAGNKANVGKEPERDDGALADDDALVDEQSEESFPASDPPSNR